MPEGNALTIEIIRENNYDIDSIDLIIRQYLSLTEKKILIEKILDICMVEDGIKRIDFALKMFAYEYMLLKLYSNINIETDDIIELYDELKENNLIDKILKLIPESEIELINYILDKEIEQIQLVDNSLSSVVSKRLGELVEKLPDSKEINKMIPKISKQINKISPDSFKFLTDAIGWSKGDKNA